VCWLLGLQGVYIYDRLSTSTGRERPGRGRANGPIVKLGIVGGKANWDLLKAGARLTTGIKLPPSNRAKGFHLQSPATIVCFCEGAFAIWAAALYFYDPPPSAHSADD